jgi:hypothetical protein
METCTEKLVDELVEVKTGIKMLQKKEQHLKKQLLPLIAKGESITLPNVEIFCAEQKTKQSIQKSDLLEFLLENYGEEVLEEATKLYAKDRPASLRSVRVKLKDVDE